MRILSLTLPLFILVMAAWISDSPHGDDFKPGCDICHSPGGWHIDPGVYAFVHDTTRFPLEGQHVSVNCRDCHPTLVFKDAGTECSACHTDIHSGTVGQDCERCHNSFSWLVSDITEIHQLSRFPLLGAHRSADCSACHASASLLLFEPLGTECIDCHLQDYQSATSPNHVLGNFSTDCAGCHNIDAYSWGGAGFDHSFFPLTGGHELYDCSRCHSGTDYADVSSECSSCHLADFNATTNPSHLAAGFPAACTECHTTAPGWRPAQYDHSVFALTQGHAISECNRCHNVSDYSDISSECSFCHLADYNATTNPSHLAIGLSTDCMECHSTLPGWKPAEFDVHDAQFFPIFSGEHRGEWNSCAECHTNPDNYSLFSCLECHEHSRERMDDEHKDEDGYSYNSLACLECHPTGEGDD